MPTNRPSGTQKNYLNFTDSKNTCTLPYHRALGCAEYFVLADTIHSDTCNAF